MALATPIVTVDGAALPPSVLLVSVEVVREVGRIPHARLVFDDGEVPAKRLAALDLPALVPGAGIAIDVRMGTRTTLLFRGLLVRLRMEVRGGVPRLVATCKDQTWALTRPRRSAVYPESSDADAVGTILTRAGVRHGELGGDAVVHEELVQWDATDWDFILARAAANGLAVVVKDGSLSMRDWRGKGAAVLDLEFGRDPNENIELELDAGGQGEDVDAVGWDPVAGAPTEPAAGAAFATGQGDLDPVDAAAGLGLGATRLSHLAPLPPGELRAWAGGRLARERLAMLRGRVRLAGVAVELLDRIKLAGVGKRFNGPALVGGVRHVVEANAWSTDLQLGLPAAPPPNIAASAEPLLPPARGLAIGLVEEPEEDPLGERRVRVRLPGLVAGGDAGGLVWARMATPEAGTERGVSFRPRAGDEVVVGFLADDPRHPVVLGAMFGSRVAPHAPFAATDADVARGFGSAAASVEMIEGDDKASLRLRVGKSALTIALADGAETITLADANGNSLVMDKDGIRLTSTKAFALTASGEATLKAESFAVETSGDTIVKAKGFGVDVSGSVTIKGASVALN